MTIQKLPMNPIPKELCALLGATHINRSDTGIVTLHQGNSFQTIARMEGVRIRHSLDMDGNERTAAWRETIEHILQEAKP